MTTASVERSEVRFGTKTIEYSIRRSSRRTTVSIAIDPAEGVLVTAPSPAPVNRLDEIVHAKATWIVQRLKRQSDLPPPMEKEFVSGESFLYLGRQYRLRLGKDEEPRPLRLENGWLHVPLPPHLGGQHRSGYVRAALIDWYKRNAKRRIGKRVIHWAAKLDVNVPEMLLSEPRTRWGSASSSGALRINWRIIQASNSLVDYVVAHELTHLRHPDHTPGFWACLGRTMPDYEQRKQRLRTIGPALEW